MRYPKTILRIRLLLIISALAISLSARYRSFAQDPNLQLESTQAKELIKLAREAIGGETVLNKLQTITATGKYIRYTKCLIVESPKLVEEELRALPGKIEFEFALPDKFRRRVSFRDHNPFVQVVSGVEAWRDPPLQPMSLSKERQLIDVSDVERTLFRQRVGAKQELSYLSIGLLMLQLPEYQFEMRYRGLNQLGDDNAYEISAEGPSGFQFTLFLDAKTYVPVGLMVPFVEEYRPQVFAQISADKRLRRETLARVRFERNAKRNPFQSYEMLMRFSNRRTVNGVSLPFRITTLLNGEKAEEMSINRFKINGPVDFKLFEPPPKN